MSSRDLLQILRERRTGSVQGRRNGADLDPKHTCDRCVVEVEVKAKKERIALSWREPPHRIANAANVVLESPRFPSRLRHGRRRVGPANCIASRVHHTSPDPRIQGATSTEALPCADRSRKPLLNRILCKLGIGRHCDGESEEVKAATSIDSLNRVERRSIRSHHPE
jgi:hypothetical protein